MVSRKSGVTKVVGPPPNADDFKVIPAIGPGIERRLHKAGIQTFAQLATRSPAEIATLVADLAGMSAERIAQLDWIGQARDLASELVEINPQAEGTFVREHQHYATFTLELLLDEDNNVRRTRMVHIQDQEEESWAGWEATRMINLVIKQAGLQLPVNEPTPAVVVTNEPVVAAAAPVESDAPVDPHEPAIAVEASLAHEDNLAVNLDGVLHLRTLETVPAGTAEPHHILRHNQPFSIQLTLDFTEVTGLNSCPLPSIVSIYAKNMQDGSRHLVNESKDLLTPQDKLTLTLPGTFWSPGTYRLEAMVTLIFPTGTPGLLAYLEGGLLQVD